MQTAQILCSLNTVFPVCFTLFVLLHKLEGGGGGGASAGVMVLGKLPGLRHPTIWMTVGQGPTALAVGAGVGVVWIFLFSSIFSLLFLPLSVGDSPI